MSDIVTDPKLDDLERRVQTLETKVAALRDAREIDERIKANQPPVDSAGPPSFKDIELPIANVQTVVATARTTWALVEMLAEIKTLLWMFVDRRYHMGWLTRLVAIGLMIAILVSHWWVPFGGYDNVASRLIDKCADLVLGLVLFMFLSFETRRYKEWRSKR